MPNLLQTRCRRLLLISATVSSTVLVSCLDKPTEVRPLQRATRACAFLTRVAGASLDVNPCYIDTTGSGASDTTSTSWRDHFGLNTLYATGLPLSMALGTHVGWVRIGVA